MRISLESCVRERHRLLFSYRVGGRRFTKTYRYGDTDLIELEGRFGVERLERIYFHIMALEALPLTGFQPEVLDLQAFERFCTDGFRALWKTIFRKAGAQWRYENDLADYAGPAFSGECAAPDPEPLMMEPGEVEALAFCGGGKDSLVALKLLGQGQVSFASYQYAHSSYGPPDEQERLIAQVLNRTNPARRHIVQVEDSPAVEGGLCAETPISVFGALPVVLQHGYRYVVLGHERSADTGNLVWSKTGETVNHQWGKSSEAERLINGYIRRELVANFAYCSVLKPIYDVVIFNLLRGYQDAAESTHSCNVRKPWCGECAKCAYVGLNFLAYLPTETASRIFPRNILDTLANEGTYRQMLGLESHRPFECVGEIDEARLALEICSRKGIEGRAVRIYQREGRRIDLGAALKRYLSVEGSAMPVSLERRILPLLQEGARAAGDYIGRFF